MRPDVGEEMSRQPSLPPSALREPWCGPRVSRAEQPEHTEHDDRRQPPVVAITRARTHRPRSHATNQHNNISPPDP
jgi:hypothetical protein